MGIHCETKMDYCQNITCENNGVYRSLFRDYKCECVSDSYSGRHCEMTANKLVAIKMMTKSFASIVITFLILLVAFVGTMDVLEYVFHIDPAANYRKRLKRIKPRQEKTQTRIAIRFTYVNAVEPMSTIQETTV